MSFNKEAGTSENRHDQRKPCIPAAVREGEVCGGREYRTVCPAQREQGEPARADGVDEGRQSRRAQPDPAQAAGDIPSARRRTDAGLGHGHSGTGKGGICAVRRVGAGLFEAGGQAGDRKAGGEMKR